MRTKATIELETGVAESRQSGHAVSALRVCGAGSAPAKPPLCAVR